jgi:hypothetical protein
LLERRSRSCADTSRFGRAYREQVRIEYPGFGEVVVEGTRYDHDVVIERGVVRPRRKGPSKASRARFGHTPLTAGEDIPWTAPRLVIGTGYSGALPVTSDVVDAAAAAGVEVVAMPTAEAVTLLNTLDAAEANAVLHVTC